MDKFNKQEIYKIVSTAKRTLKILAHLQEGLTDGEIMKKTDAERALINYYRNRIKK